MRVLEDLFRDIPYAIRQLRRAPVLTIGVLLCLALGIGANTAIFAAIDAVVFRTLPIPNSKNLYMLTWSAPSGPRPYVSDMLGGGPFSDNGSAVGMRAFSYDTFNRIRERNHVFSATIAVAGNHQDVNAETNGAASSALMQGVSGNYFDGLGVSGALGRMLTVSDDQESQPPVAVISYSFWESKLGRNPSVVGRPVVINGSPITIVGVAPRGFFGLAPGTAPDLWVPLSVYMSQQAYSPGSRSQIGTEPPTAFPYWKRPRTWWLQIVGRIQPDRMPDQARLELQGLFDQSLRDASGPSATLKQRPTVDLVSMKRGGDGLRLQYSTALYLLMGVVGLVLMIACGNVAALLLSRATARQRELAIRLSLGAGRRRLIRQLLTESLLLAVAGGVLGLLIAFWADSLLIRLLSSGQSPLNVQINLSATVLAFTGGISILTGMFFGSIPAWRATRLDPVRTVRQTTTWMGTSDRRFSSGRLVLAGQLALCFVLVMGAGLCLGTLQNLHHIDAGFNPNQLLLFTARPGLNGYKDDNLTFYYEDLKRRIESLPGVRAVSLSTRAPVGQGTGNSGVIIPGYTPVDTDIGINRHQVGADYFETIGIPITAGRGIGKQDGVKGHRVVVVNEKLVRDFFRGDNPIGHSIFLGTLKGPEYEIVGVAKDVKYNRMQEAAPATIYYPYLQFLSVPNAMVFEVRITANIASVIDSIRREALLLDSAVPIASITTEAQLIEETFAVERTLATLSAMFGALAVFLVATGLYGTIAYAVTRQTKEIGIRMALGAQRQAILANILGEIASIVAAGLGGGVLLSFAVTPVLRERLFGLAPHDIRTAAASALVIVLVMIVAGYLPARRASRIDPMKALRYE
jgi:predicted permease